MGLGCDALRHLGRWRGGRVVARATLANPGARAPTFNRTALRPCGPHTERPARRRDSHNIREAGEVGHAWLRNAERAAFEKVWHVCVGGM